MPEVVALELAVVLDHEVVGLGHERLEDAGGDVGVAVRAERVADVVEQGAQHVLVVAAVALGAGRGLQAVLQPVDREAAVVELEVAHQPDDAFGDVALGDLPAAA